MRETGDVIGGRGNGRAWRMLGCGAVDGGTEAFRVAPLDAQGVGGAFPALDALKWPWEETLQALQNPEGPGTLGVVGALKP
jgi:hypothetical protein